MDYDAPVFAPLRDAKEGDKVTINNGQWRGTWIKIQASDPPYVERQWVNIDTGAICEHWTYLAKAQAD